MLNKLKADKSLEFPHVDSSDFLIFKREKKTYYKWEQVILGLSNVVDAEQVQKIQNQVILATGFADLKELLYMRPDSGSNFVLSSSEPFNEEMEIEYDKFVNWLDHFGLPMFHIHCSGHIMPTEAKQVINKIGPATFFPIHTQNPELYSKFVSDVTKVKLPQRSTTYQLQSSGEWK